MKRLVLLAFFLFLSPQAEAMEFRNVQEAWVYLGRVPREKGIRLLSSQQNPLDKKGGRFCRRTGGKQSHFILLDVEDRFFEGNPPRVEVTVEYFDGGKDTFTTLARTLEGPRRRVGRIIEKENSGRWLSYSSSVLAPLFGPREDRATEADLLIHNRWDGEEFIRTVRVRIPYLHLETGRVGNLFKPGEAITLRAKLFKRGAPEKWVLQWDVKDWKAEEIHSGHAEVLAKSGFSVAEEILLPPLPLGAYALTVTLKRGESVLEKVDFSFGVSLPVTLKENWTDSPFGVCTELVTPFATPKAKLLKDSGIFWFRQGIRGEQIYATGKADWKALDEAVHAANAQGLQIMGMFLGAPPRTGDFSTEKSRKAFARYTAEVAQRYPSITHWEIWNEPDTIAFWGDRDWKRYFALLKEVHRSLKEVSPSCTVLNGGLVVGNYWYLGELYRAGAKGVMDIVAIHPYADAPESGKRSLAGRIQAARSILAKHDPGRKLWLTEIGWHTSTSGASLREQASLLVRTMAVALSYPEVKKIFWFTFENFGEDLASGVQNSGLVFRDLSPKPSLIAYRTLIQRLTGKQFVKREDFGKGIFAYRFEGEEEVVLILWSLQERPVILPKGKDLQGIDMMGNPLALSREKVEIPVGRDPLFVFWQKQ
ncbi:MAG: hypothetical protein HY590_00180 [Candidatus Omnitrophica bacterium]|nr:hypothetical protein [Candidatus Omnitrophota bacterium]